MLASYQLYDELFSSQTDGREQFVLRRLDTRCARSTACRRAPSLVERELTC